MNFDNFDLIRLFTSLQLILLCLALLIIKSKGKQSKILALFLMALGLFILSGVYTRVYDVLANKNLLFILYIVFSFSYLIGPAFYLYIRSIISNDLKYKHVFLIHFIPFYVLLISNILYLHIPGSDIFELDKTFNTSAFHIAAITFLHLQILTYIICSLNIFIKNNQNNRNSKKQKILKSRLNWMKYLTYSIFIIWVMESLVHFTYTNFLLYLCEIKIILSGTHFTLANSIVIIGLKKPEIFNNLPQRTKYKKNILKENVKNGLLTELKQYMENESPYLDPDLSFQCVAQKMNISTHQLSQLLNTSLNMNFYDYINSYRIEAAKKFLISFNSSQKTILEIMYDVGFSSKSAFNNAFKKHTGVTPSLFRKHSNS